MKLNKPFCQPSVSTPNYVSLSVHKSVSSYVTLSFHVHPQLYKNEVSNACRFVFFHKMYAYMFNGFICEINANMQINM